MPGLQRRRGRRFSWFGACSDQEKPWIPFGYAQGRLFDSWLRRFAPDDTLNVSLMH
jgi:hypothetical protein